MFSRVRALIFDLDGLLIESETGYRQAWLQALLKMGYSIQAADLQQLAGISAEQLLPALEALLKHSLDLALFSQLSCEYWQTHVELYGIPVMPGVSEVLVEASRLGWPVAVATNSHRHQAEKLLVLAGLENQFSVLVGRDQVDRPKPAPDVFLRAAEYLELPGSQCLVLEDSLIGVHAALVAAMPVCYIPSTPDLSVLSDLPDLKVLNSLTELADGMRLLSV